MGALLEVTLESVIPKERAEFEGGFGQPSVSHSFRRCCTKMPESAKITDRAKGGIVSVSASGTSEVQEPNREPDDEQYR